LSVIYETNILNLIIIYLDNNYKYKQKYYNVQNLKKIDLNMSYSKYSATEEATAVVLSPGTHLISIYRTDEDRYFSCLCDNKVSLSGGFH